MPKFRVLRGRHTEGQHPNGDLIIYCGPRTIRERGKDDVRVSGDVIETDCNLMVLNKQSSTKFEEVADNTPITHNSGQPLKVAGKKASASALAVAEVESDGLESLTRAKLMEIVEEEEIAVDATMKKDEIVNAIRIDRDLANSN